MGKIAFVFAGQGAQYSGMGQSLCEMSPAARAVFDVADKLRPGTSQQCFTAPVEELSITENTQPCLYCVDLAAAKALEGGRCAGGRGGGLLPGGDCRPELCRCVHAGAGLRLCVQGGAGPCRPLGRQTPAPWPRCSSSPTSRWRRCAPALKRCGPSTTTAPAQLVCAGEKSQIEAFCQKVEEAGGRAKMLAVSGGFHSPFMESASQGPGPRAGGDGAGPLQGAGVRQLHRPAL